MAKATLSNIQMPLGAIFISLCAIGILASIYRNSLHQQKQKQTQYMEPKYLFCLPQGDIVDMCSVVYKCIKYAEKYNRIVVIDSTVNSWFNDDINDYIQIHSPHVYTGTAKSITEKIKNLATYPPNINILNPNTVTIENARNTDLNKSYNESVLVYSDNKTEPNSLTQLLEISTFSPKLIYAYKRLNTDIPSNYVGISIEKNINSHQLANFITNNNNILSHNSIYLVSAEITVLDTFKSYYGKRIFTNVPQINTYEETHKKRNTNAFVDVILLAKAKLYYSLNMEHGLSSEVETLRNSPHIINRLTT